MRTGNWEKQFLKRQEAWNLCVEGGCKEAVEDARKEPICSVALIIEESLKHECLLPVMANWVWTVLNLVKWP